MKKKQIADNQISGILSVLEEMHPEASCALEHRDRFQLLVAVMLSAQTTDISVNKVTPELFGRYPDAAAMAEADPLEIQEIIRTIGLYKNKSKNVVAMAKMLCEEYGGEVPGDFSKLVRLPGVGRKTANVVLAEGFGEPRIAVDTHVFRVANRIGLTDGENPAEVEEKLMKRLPKDLWIRAHHLLIFHGRKLCHARKPDCSACGLRDACVYFKESGEE